MAFFQSKAKSGGSLREQKALTVAQIGAALQGVKRTDGAVCFRCGQVNTGVQNRETVDLPGALALTG
jgi:hypothetical protein